MIFGGMNGGKDMQILTMRNHTMGMNRLVDSIPQFPY